MILHAPAKLNLFFEILGKRPDGYHEILTVTTPVTLFDTLSMELSTITTLACQREDGTDFGGEIPTDDRNLILKGMTALSEATGVSKPVAFRLTKRIPSQAGLGGGSSDAAAALWGLNRLWNLHLSLDALRRIGANVGSDVPLFFEKGLALGRGRGEITSSLPDAGPMTFVIYKPSFGLSTAEVYAACSESMSGLMSGAVSDRQSVDPLLAALKRNDLSSAAPFFFNRLEEGAGRVRPEIAGVKRFLTKSGASAFRMTGSGTAFYVPCFNLSAAEESADRLRRSVSGDVFVVRSGRFSDQDLF